MVFSCHFEKFSWKFVCIQKVFLLNFYPFWIRIRIKMLWDPESAGKLMRIQNTGYMYRENGFKYSRGRISVISHVFNFLHVYLILFKKLSTCVSDQDGCGFLRRSESGLQPGSVQLFALIYPKSTNKNCNNLQSKLNIICPYIKYIIFNRPLMFIDKFLEEPGQNECWECHSFWPFFVIFLLESGSDKKKRPRTASASRIYFFFKFSTPNTVLLG